MSQNRVKLTGAACWGVRTDCQVQCVLVHFALQPLSSGCNKLETYTAGTSKSHYSYNCHAIRSIFQDPALLPPVSMHRQ